MNRVITIGREFGSGGRTIAGMVGKELGIPVYDHELLVRIAQESGFAKEYVEEKGESASLNSLIARSLSGMGGYSPMTAEDYLWQMQRKVILELAQKENCVIVGRCADYILRERADCLRAFIYADREKRARRIVAVYGEAGAEMPEKRLLDKDKRRSAFYSAHTDMTWGDPHNYHICLDSGALGLEQCAQILCGIYRKMEE
ncbi:MAG: cytidylate kinase-like family protein [Eubacteriales bacterium]|nr:cytidylate kinase-like family protein [Eubacteriales bacterium]